LPSKFEGIAFKNRRILKQKMLSEFEGFAFVQNRAFKMPSKINSVLLCNPDINEYQMHQSICISKEFLHQLLCI